MKEESIYVVVKGVKREVIAKRRRKNSTIYDQIRVLPTIEERKEINKCIQKFRNAFDELFELAGDKFPESIQKKHLNKFPCLITKMSLDYQDDLDLMPMDPKLLLETMKARYAD